MTQCEGPYSIALNVWCVCVCVCMYVCVCVCVCVYVCTYHLLLERLKISDHHFLPLFHPQYSCLLSVEPAKF